MHLSLVHPCVQNQIKTVAEKELVNVSLECSRKGSQLVLSNIPVV